VIDILGLMGDAVDNIPGIPGVGEKTAAKLLAEYGTLESILDNADKIKGALGEKVKAGKDLAIMSKKLATIITNVPLQFHEEDFRLKEWNKEALKDVFADLEFRTIAKRLIGEEILTAAGVPAAPAGVQQDLFGNVVEKGNGRAAEAEAGVEEEEEEKAALVVDKNIHNSPHTYSAAVSEAEISKLVEALKKESEICFDTETTGIDPNNVELVGLSFAIKAGEAFYIPCPADQGLTRKVLAQFAYHACALRH
jgi:DNA polymerase-1